MREKLNCPNCGAPIESHKCAYCGTVFYDFAEFEVGKSAYIRMKIHENLNVFKALLNSVDVLQETDEIMYADNAILQRCYPTTKMTLDLTLLPDDRGIIMERYMQK